MAKLPPFPGTTGRRDWRTAFDAIRKLLANGDDTTQVFRIMKALNVGNAPMNYARLIATEEGGRLAYNRVELTERFGDAAWVAQFAPGTVGAAYREFLPYVQRIPYPRPGGIQTVLDTLAPTNPRAATARPEEFYDDRFIRELDESGFFRALYGE